MQIEKKVFDRLGILIAAYTAIFVMVPFLSARIIEVFNMKLLVGSIAMIIAHGLLDVINEGYGPEKAKQTVLTAVVIRLFIWCFIALSYMLPTFRQPDGYQVIMLSGFRLLVAGEVTLVLTQYFLDVPVFAWLKRKTSYGFWVRYNLSNILSQSLLTCLFITMAFIGTGKPIVELIFYAILFRTIVSMTLTPLFVGLLSIGLKNERDIIKAN